MISENIVYCGLDCSKCDAFKATQTGDDNFKKRIAERWTRELDTEFTPQEIECNGCRSERISGWCSRICSIRPCAEARGVETCAHCTDYPCEKIEKFLSSEPVARANLEQIRNSI